MKNQETLNQIATLSSTIEPLSRVGKKNDVDIVVKKLIELVGELD